MSPLCLPPGAEARALLAIEPSRQRPPRREALEAARRELKLAVEAILRFASAEGASPQDAHDLRAVFERAGAGERAFAAPVDVAFGAAGGRSKRRRAGSDEADGDDDESLVDGGWPAFLGPKRPRPDASVTASLPSYLDGDLPASLLAMVRRAAGASGPTAQVGSTPASAQPAPSSSSSSSSSAAAAASSLPPPSVADSTRRAIEASAASHIDLLAVPWPPVADASAASDVTATTVLPRHLVCSIPPASKRTARMAAKQALHPHAVLARLPEEVLRWRARLRVNDDVFYYHHCGGNEAVLGTHTVRSVRACARRPQWLQRVGKDSRTGASQRAAASAPRALAAAAADSEPELAARSLAPLEALAEAAAVPGSADDASSGDAQSDGRDSGVAGVWLSEAKRAAAKEEAHDELVLAGRGVGRQPVITLDMELAGDAAARAAAGEEAAALPPLQLRYGLVFLVDWLDDELQLGKSPPDADAIAEAEARLEAAETRLAAALAAEPDALAAAGSASSTQQSSRASSRRRAVKAETGSSLPAEPDDVAEFPAVTAAAALWRARNEAHAALESAREACIAMEARSRPTQTWLDWGTLSVLAPLQLNMFLFDSIKDDDLPAGTAAMVAPSVSDDVEVPEAVTNPEAVVKQYLSDEP